VCDHQRDLRADHRISDKSVKLQIARRSDRNLQAASAATRGRIPSRPTPLPSRNVMDKNFAGVPRHLAVVALSVWGFYRPSRRSASASTSRGAYTSCSASRQDALRWTPRHDGAVREAAEAKGLAN